MAKTALLRQPRSLGAAFITACSLAWLLGTCPVGAAADDKLADGLRNNENGQQQIQTQAQEFAAQLHEMSAEFERNGLNGDEVKTLNLLSASIGTMSEQDMTRIINLLRQARTVGDQRTVLQQVAAAYAGQKTLTTEMRGLLASFQKDQAAADVAAALSKLAERQAANLQTGITTAQWTEGKKPDDGSDMKAAMDVQGSEQAALRDEARQAASRLQAAARNASDPAAAAKAQEALQKFGALNAALDQAAKDLQESHLFKALTNEKAARDGMRQLARELAPLRESPADALRASEREMADMIAQQKEMLAAAQKIKEAPADIDQWLQQQLKDPNSKVNKIVEKEKDLAGLTPDQLKENAKVKGTFNGEAAKNKQELSAMESKANDLANRSDQVSQDLKQDAAQAAAAVKASQEKMQAARADLDDKNAAQAVQNQQAALAQMEQAQKQVQAQIAAEDAARNADRMTQLQAAKQQVQQLTAQQQAASQQQAAQPQAAASNAAQETGLQNKTQAVQDKVAQAQSPGAAAALQQAANQMQKAAGALSQPGAQPQAQAAAAAATAALQQAGAQLDKDIAQTAAAQQQLQQVDQVLASLEKIIAGQEKVQSDTTMISGNAAKPAKDVKAVAQTGANPARLATQQAGLKADTATLVLALNTPEIKPAADPLNSAENQMETSHAALLKANAAAALDPQRFAMTDLLQAKELLNAKKAQLTQQTNPAAAAAAQQQQAAALADQIAQAQAQAAAAQAQIAQAQAAAAGSSDPSQPQSGQQQSGQQQSGQQQSGQQQSGQQQSGQQQSGQQQSGSQSSSQMQAAQQSLDNAANAAGQAAANSPSGAPSDALQQSLADAQQALNQAASSAAQGDQAGAQAQTAKAQQALAQAQGQAQAAQSGLAQADAASGSTPAGGSPQGGSPQGGSPQGGSPQGGSPQGGSPQGGQPSSSAQASSSSGPSPGGPGPGGPGESSDPSSSSDGSPRDASQIGQGSIQTGSRGAVRQGSAFAKLPARDRAALQQSQAEKYPQEYGSMIEQYMQSLADQPGS